MKILITGGSGFIGKNLVESLSRKYEVDAPTHGELDFLDEFAVDRYLKHRKFDMVIHAASIPYNRKVKDRKNITTGHLRMFFNIARNSDRFSKIIFLGSGSEYDMRSDISRAGETDFGKHIPVDELGFSKYICSRYIEKSNNIINLRLFGVFGKYEDYQIRFISNAICKTLFDLPITIKQNRFFSYLYINDLYAVIERLIDHDLTHRIYNIVPSEISDLMSIAKKVNEISKKNLKIIVHAPGLGKEYTGDGALFMKEAGKFEFTPLETAIEKLYEWYERNKNTIDREKLLIDP